MLKFPTCNTLANSGNKPTNEPRVFQQGNRHILNDSIDHWDYTVLGQPWWDRTSYFQGSRSCTMSAAPVHLNLEIRWWHWEATGTLKSCLGALKYGPLGFGLVEPSGRVTVIVLLPQSCFWSLSSLSQSASLACLNSPGLILSLLVPRVVLGAWVPRSLRKPSIVVPKK